MKCKSQELVIKFSSWTTVTNDDHHLLCPPPPNEELWPPPPAWPPPEALLVCDDDWCWWWLVDEPWQCFCMRSCPISYFLSYIFCSCASNYSCSCWNFWLLCIENEAICFSLDGGIIDDCRRKPLSLSSSICDGGKAPNYASYCILFLVIFLPVFGSIWHARPSSPSPPWSLFCLSPPFSSALPPLPPAAPSPPLLPALSLSSLRRLSLSFCCC